MGTLGTKLKVLMDEGNPKVRAQNEVLLIQCQIGEMLAIVGNELGFSEKKNTGSTELAELLGCEAEFITKLKDPAVNIEFSIHQIARLALLFGKVPVIEFRDENPEEKYTRLCGVATQVKELTEILRARIPKKE